VRLAFAAVSLSLAALQFVPGTISGTVIKAHTVIQQPLPNARLELRGGPGGPIVVRSDGSGRFVFSNIVPGQYTLAVTCDGFIRQEFPKKISVGGGQQTGNILFELDPAPTAGGRVLDSFGEPITNIIVEAQRRSYDVLGNPGLTPAAASVTDDRGEYRIFWLDPGEYFLYAASPLPDPFENAPRPVVAPTYYPGVNVPEDARPLRLDAGRDINVDFRLRNAALWAVTGQTMSGLTGRSTGASVALTPPAEDPALSRYRSQSLPAGPSAGQVAIDKVPPGSYIIAAKSGSGDQEITAYQRIVLRPALVAPEFGYRVSLTLSPPLAINGRLFVESREAIDLRAVSVGLLSVDPDLPSPKSVLALPSGQFALQGVVAGTYVLETSNLPGDFYLKAARFGDADVLEKPLTLEPGQAVPPLQILLGSDGGRLQAAAYNSKGEPRSGAKLVLVPDVLRRERREQYRLATSVEDGVAIFRGIPPGNYRLFAWEALEPNGYLNSDYLQPFEAFGVPVNIKTGANPAVGIRVIAKE
jgi:hypothetical protein